MSRWLEVALTAFTRALDWFWRLGSRCPLIVLGLLLALHTVPLLDSRALWFSDEIRYADAFTQLYQNHKWLVLYLNGVFYPDKPPLYFWFLSAIKATIGFDGPALFFLGAAISAYLFLSATYALARQVLGVNRETAFSAGLVLLSVFYFIGLAHYSRMDLLFGALIVASHICLYRAWCREEARWLAVAGGLLAGLATLTKGPLGLAFPLLSTVTWLGWRWRLSRLLRRDALYALLAAAIVPILWVIAVFAFEDSAYLVNVFKDQIYRRATDTWHHAHPVWHYLLTLPAAWLPWTFALAGVSWRRLASRAFWTRLYARRRAPGGLSYLWCMFISGFVLLSVVSIKIVVYLLPLFAPLAVLSGRHLLSLPSPVLRRVYTAVAGLWALVALALPWMNLAHPWPIKVAGLAPCAALAALIAWLLFRFVPRLSARSALLFCALLTTLWSLQAGAMLVPSLDPVMSPKVQGERMKNYIGQGYYPVGYRIYSGTYTWYAGQDIHETADLDELSSVLQSRPRVVMGMKKKHWDAWENRPENLRVVHEQWIVDEPFVLVIQDAEV